LIAFITFLNPKSRICIRMGHVVMLWAFANDMLTLGFSAKQLSMSDSENNPGQTIDSSLIVLSAMNIAAAGLSLILLIWHCTFQDEHFGESQMPKDKMAVTWTLAALNGALSVIRLSFASDYTNKVFSGNFNQNTSNVITLQLLPLWTFTCLYGLLSLLTTFMYTMRWSRPTFYLNGVFLAIAFINDFTCLGWASKMIDVGAPSGLESEALAFAALSIISGIVAVVQAFVHIWSSPPHPEASWFGACGLNDMKLTGSARSIHLGLSLPNLILRLVRVGLAADLWNKFLANGNQTGSSVNSISWTTWGAMGFAAAVSGHYYGFFFTKSTYMLHFLMLLFALSWDMGSAAFAVTQWVGGLDQIPNQDEFQAHASLSFIQCIFMIITLIVFLAKSPMPNEDDENTNTSSTPAIPLS